MEQQQQQILQPLPIADPCHQRIKEFLDTILPESASANALERELAAEKCKKRKAEEKRRKLKHRIKILLEDLKAIEVSVHQSETKISNLEFNLSRAVATSLC